MFIASAPDLCPFCIFRVKMQVKIQTLVELNIKYFLSFHFNKISIAPLTTIGILL